ncbi:MAG: hydrogenase maturation protease [Infirmifilum sp.]
MSENFLVVGIGNPLYGDDAIGPLLAEAFAECGVRAVNAELDAFTVASYLEGVELVIFIDVFDQSYGKVGDLVKVRLDPKLLSPEEVAEFLSRDTGAHNVSPAHVAVLAYASGRFKGDVWVIGPVAANTSFGTPPSFETVNKVREIIREVSEILNLYLDEKCILESFNNKFEELRNYIWRNQKASPI